MAKNAEQVKNNNDEKHEEKLGLFVKVPEETRHIIDKYKEEGMTISNLIESAIKMYDNYNSMDPGIHAIINKYKTEDEEESIISFLEKAIQFYGDQKNLDRDLWVRARDEMKMMLIGKTTFNQLIHAAELPQDARERAFTKNVALDLILWYTGKPLDLIPIEEVINTVQKMWVVANYFYKIDVKKESEDEFHIMFKHRQNKRYSEYWLGYFTKLFNSEELSSKCLVEGHAFDETISMTIKVGYKK